jgi:hypothetical protein
MAMNIMNKIAKRKTSNSKNDVLKMYIYYFYKSQRLIPLLVHP